MDSHKKKFKKYIVSIIFSWNESINQTYIDHPQTDRQVLGCYGNRDQFVSHLAWMELIVYNKESKEDKEMKYICCFLWQTYACDQDGLNVALSLTKL